ncbi:MAG TPA: bidirectional hydrogenase complex protein HoxE [Anaeromyxobacteraceae bacterium]|nr:bidirectional hydrogenase complex protein HoxE [Anaeromyxobacteraceae bacterium]
MTTTASAPAGAPAHPSGDKRFKMLDAAMKRHQFQGDALLEILHQAQELFGFLADDVLLYVARGLRLPPSRVYGVATFYNFFTLKPKGAHTCTVCMGTACYVKGAGEILGALEARHGVKAGETTADGQLSVVVARCVGACGIAPAVAFDAEVSGQQTPATVLARVAAFRAGGEEGA